MSDAVTKAEMRVEIDRLRADFLRYLVVQTLVVIVGLAGMLVTFVPHLQ
jgi:hypothetical protein